MSKQSTIEKLRTEIRREAQKINKRLQRLEGTKELEFSQGYEMVLKAKSNPALNIATTGAKVRVKETTRVTETEQELRKHLRKLKNISGKVETRKQIQKKYGTNLKGLAESATPKKKAEYKKKVEEYERRKNQYRKNKLATSLWDYFGELEDSDVIFGIVSDMQLGETSYKEGFLELMERNKARIKLWGYPEELMEEYERLTGEEYPQEEEEKREKGAVYTFEEIKEALRKRKEAEEQ